jgi:hypothetical protein
MYRDVTLGNTEYRANLGILNDHRITIKNGQVSVSADLDGRTPGAEFEATFTGRGDNRVLVAPEDTIIGNAIMEPGDDLKIAKAKKLAEIAAERWKAEVGGVAGEGLAIDTSRESQALITGAALAATLDPNYICQWKTSSGFVTLDAATVLTVAQAVRAHVQGCFDREAELSAAVEAAGTAAEMEAIAWDI